MGLLSCSYWSRCAGIGHRSRQTRSGTSRYEALLEYLEGRRLPSVSAAGHLPKGPDTAIVADNNQYQGGSPPPLGGQGDQGGGPSAAHHGVGNLGPQDSTPPAPPPVAQQDAPLPAGQQGSGQGDHGKPDGNQGQDTSLPTARTRCFAAHRDPGSSPDAHGKASGNQGQDTPPPTAQQDASPPTAQQADETLDGKASGNQVPGALRRRRATRCFAARREPGSRPDATARRTGNEGPGHSAARRVRGHSAARRATGRLPQSRSRVAVETLRRAGRQRRSGRCRGEQGSSPDAHGRRTATKIRTFRRPPRNRNPDAQAGGRQPRSHSAARRATGHSAARRATGCSTASSRSRVAAADAHGQPGRQRRSGRFAAAAKQGSSPRRSRQGGRQRRSGHSAPAGGTGQQRRRSRQGGRQPSRTLRRCRATGCSTASRAAG